MQHFCNSHFAKKKKKMKINEEQDKRYIAERIKSWRLVYHSFYRHIPFEHILSLRTYCIPSYYITGIRVIYRIFYVSKRYQYNYDYYYCNYSYYYSYYYHQNTINYYCHIINAKDIGTYNIKMGGESTTKASMYCT